MTTKLSPQQLTEAAARWLGLDYHIYNNRVFSGKDEPRGVSMEFNPLYDRNDLVPVEKKLLKEGYGFQLYPLDSTFCIVKNGILIKEGSYPADYSMAVLELVEKLVKEVDEYAATGSTGGYKP